MSWDGSKSNLQREGHIHDGSFEHQMIFRDPYIPSISEFANANYWIDGTAWQKIAWDHRDTGSGVVIDPGMSNHWVQTGPTTGDRWVISGDNFYPNEPGYQGKYSAKFVFGDDPESPWLIPFYVENNPWFYDDGWTEDQIVANTWTMTHAGNGPFPTEHLSDGGFIQIVNPLTRTETLSMYAWSDAPCEIEIYFRLWTDAFGDFDPDTFTTDLLVDSKLFALSPETWSECKGVFDIPFRIHPNYPDGNPDWSDTYFFQFKIRAVGGSPGQVVYLDNGFSWVDLTTAASGLITVGVSEWVQDDKDMYIGAYLWFKTYSGVSGGSAT